MNFRFWMQKMWYEHVDELTEYQQPVPYEAKEYFARYKWWLKREYRYRKSQGLL